jgi:hypothetical protein
MGNDGGTIVKRRDLVKERKKKRRIRGLTANNVAYCFLSGKPLSRDAVVCRMGHIYNKEAMLKALIA